MTYYVTGTSITLVRDYVRDLVGYGQTVVSTWHNGRNTNVYQNVHELEACDTLLVLGTLPSCYVEVGIAMSCGKRIVIIGSRMNEYSEFVIYMTKEEFHESL